MLESVADIEPCFFFRISPLIEKQLWKTTLENQ